MDNRQRVKRSPGLDGTAGKDAGEAVYLSDPAFRETPAGPPVPDRWNKVHQRDPSPGQIKRMCEAIRRYYPRDPVGQNTEPWTPPEIEGPPDFDVAAVA